MNMTISINVPELTGASLTPEIMAALNNLSALLSGGPQSSALTVAAQAPQSPAQLPVQAPLQQPDQQYGQQTQVLQFPGQAQQGYPPVQPAYEQPVQQYGQQQPPQYIQPSVQQQAQPPQYAQQPGQAPQQSSVPVSTAQTYSIDQLAVAATALMESGKDISSLLQHFGAQALTQIPTDRYGEVATVLRGMGARI